LVFRGTLRALCYVDGMSQYLRSCGVLLKDFGEHVEQVSTRLRAASTAAAERLGRRVEYLRSSRISKEERAREIAAEESITDGLICVLSCVEPCRTFEIYRNRDARRLELVSRERKCLHLYHFWMHPVLGFMSARIQTWFPFSVQVCVNGREWLARQMAAAGIAFRRADNCFPWMGDWQRAQRLFDAQLRVGWKGLLGEIARQLNPIHSQLFRDFRVGYYWSVYQSEWATDVVFAERAELRRLYPRLLGHAITSLGSPDVLRFLGRRAPARFDGEVLSDLRRREEGVRIKHWAGLNSIKAYDKAYTPQGSVLRVEMTMNCAADFRVYRPKEGEPNGKRQWRSLRKGIADLHRRAQVSQQANERYLNALAAVDDSTRLEELLARLQQPVRANGRPMRALHPFGGDLPLLEAAGRAEFVVAGLRNQDLQRRLFAGPAGNVEERRRRSALVSRKLRLLRAHGLIRKLPRSHRYRLTDFGRQAITAILAARQSAVSDLTQRAA
jgi:hypothetical protein